MEKLFSEAPGLVYEAHPVQRLGLGAWGSGLGFGGLEFRVGGLGFRSSLGLGLGLGVLGFGFGSESKKIDPCQVPQGPTSLEAILAAPLQTVSVSHKEVSIHRRRTGISFRVHQALKRTSREQVEQWVQEGKQLKYLPTRQREPDSPCRDPWKDW